MPGTFLRVRGISLAYGVPDPSILLNFFFVVEHAHGRAAGLDLRGVSAWFLTCPPVDGDVLFF